MRTVNKNGIHIEQCDGCRGIFLDRGELEQIVGAESAYYGGPAAAAAPPPYQGAGHTAPYRDSPRPYGGHGDSPRPYRGGHGYSDSPRPYQGGGYYSDSPRPYGHRGHRKRSFLEQLFD
ncbi:transcriptional regulator [Amycolatopsis deserti]|uniref:Transcriptional regulator n=2 Tax=Amycolatopsis deserti TaxID=185696 RepID=A0ABQ3J490_9PSEU|nr:transcriptional regulator [Amycolatopsis deserti]